MSRWSGSLSSSWRVARQTRSVTKITVTSLPCPHRFGGAGTHAETQKVWTSRGLLAPATPRLEIPLHPALDLKPGGFQSFPFSYSTPSVCCPRAPSASAGFFLGPLPAFWSRALGEEEGRPWRAFSAQGEAPPVCAPTLAMAAEGAAGGPSVGPGASDNLSCILRIGRALLIGFIRSLFQQHAADHPQQVEQLSGDIAAMDELALEGVSDAAQVSSLREFMLHLWRELSNNPEITSMVHCVTGKNPLKVLAEVSETMFADGINWGRIVVFFYFAYRVIAQSSSSWFPAVLEWATTFLQNRLAAWIQQQGGWVAMMNYRISSWCRQRPENTHSSMD